MKIKELVEMTDKEVQAQRQLVGSRAETRVKTHLQNTLLKWPKWHLEVVDVPGSNKPDIEVTDRDTFDTFNIQVKHVSQWHKAIIVKEFKTSRESPNPELDQVIQRVSSRLGKTFDTLESYIDHIRETKPKAGFSGDVQSSKSGYIPGLKFTSQQEEDIVDIFRDEMMKIFKSKNEKYLALYSRFEKVQLFYIGDANDSENILKMPALPYPRYATIQTSGGVGGTEEHPLTKVAIKISFEKEDIGHIF